MTAHLGPEIQRLQSLSQSISFSLTLKPAATHSAIDLISQRGTFLKLRILNVASEMHSPPVDLSPGFCLEGTDPQHTNAHKYQM